MSEPTSSTLTAEKVADYFLRQVERAETPQEPMTHMRLQKLLYYAQAWSLALSGSALFEEEVEAWEHGPVVRSVYQKFKDRGSHRLATTDVGEPLLTPEQRAVLVAVWDAYSDCTTAQLRAMTHREAPFREAYTGHELGGRCSKVISRKCMQDYFAARLERDRQSRLTRQQLAYERQPETPEERSIVNESRRLFAAL